MDIEEAALEFHIIQSRSRWTPATEEDGRSVVDDGSANLTTDEEQRDTTLALGLIKFAASISQNAGLSFCSCFLFQAVRFCPVSRKALRSFIFHLLAIVTWFENGMNLAVKFLAEATSTNEDNLVDQFLLTIITYNSSEGNQISRSDSIANVGRLIQVDQLDVVINTIGGNIMYSVLRDVLHCADITSRAIYLEIPSRQSAKYIVVITASDLRIPAVGDTIEQALELAACRMLSQLCESAGHWGESDNDNVISRTLYKRIRNATHRYCKMESIQLVNFVPDNSVQFGIRCTSENDELVLGSERSLTLSKTKASFFMMIRLILTRNTSKNYQIDDLIINVKSLIFGTVHIPLPVFDRAFENWVLIEGEKLLVKSAAANSRGDSAGSAFERGSCHLWVAFVFVLSVVVYYYTSAIPYK